MRTQIKDEEDADFENGVLRDGGRFRVDVRMCDAMSKDVAKHAANLTKPTRQHLVDGSGNAGLSLNRPGYRMLSGGAPKTQAAWDSLTQATEAAYAADLRYKETAWRDAVIDEDFDNAIDEAAKAAESSDCYADYEAEIRDSWRHGNE